MIEDDVVLLAPAEGAEVIQIVVVEKLVGDRFGCDVSRAIDELCGQKKRQASEALKVDTASAG